MSAFSTPLELFRRHPSNPILTAARWPYPVHSVFNPGATLLSDGTTLLLCRVEDRTGRSHLCAARSPDGVGGWKIDPVPTLSSSPATHPEELWGIEDPRITWVPELGKFAVVYTAFGRAGPSVALALTEDFETFERRGVVMQSSDKDAALLPHRIDGCFALIHRPITDTGAHIWLSLSPDLTHWGSHRPILLARKGGWWDAEHIGLSPPPIETPEGWLMLYHGVRRTASGAIYRLGVALFDDERFGRCIARGAPWIFGPSPSYEQLGDVPNVVFPCGVTVGPDRDSIRLYYGAADTCVALATGSVRDLLDWVRANHEE